MVEIRIADSDDELRATFPVMAQLRPHLTEPLYLERVRLQRQGERYQVAALLEDGAVRAVAGFRFATSLHAGPHVYVDDLVSDDAHRSRGHGAALLDWIARQGKERGCACLILDSGVQRHGAHRFYLRERMDIVCYNFRKAL